MRKTVYFILASLFAFSSMQAIEKPNQWIEEYIETIPDFPKPGIQFKCYPALLKSPDAFHKAILAFAERYRDMNLNAIVGLDSRGFIFGAALAYEMKLPFVMVRKMGKLPRKVEQIHYELEYGKAFFEIEVESIDPGDRVLIIDDILATGGTANAAAELVERIGGKVVEIACLIELKGSFSPKNLKHPFFSLISIDVE